MVGSTLTVEHIRRDPSNTLQEVLMAPKPKARVAPMPDPVSGAVWIPLTRARWALIDESDGDEVSRYNWHVTQAGYAARHVGRQVVRLHTQLTGMTGIDRIHETRLSISKSLDIRFL